jgi:hypothetical protein
VELLQHRADAAVNIVLAELQRAVNDISTNSSESPTHSEEPATTTPTLVPQEQAEQAPKKTGFWSKLNPFKRNKKKIEPAGQ